MSELSDIMGYESPFGEDSLFASPPEPDMWLYRIIKSTEGSELINQYLKYDYTIEEAKGIANKDIDFLIYIEIPDSNGITVEFNRVVLIKMSKVFREYLTENPKFIPYYAKEIAEKEYSYAITEEELTKAFSLELRYRNTKYLEFADEMYTENELAETFLDAVSDGFRGLKIAEEYWNPDLKSEKYLGPERFVNTAVQKLRKLYQNLKAIKEFLLKNKENVLARNLAQFIDSAMKDTASVIQWLLKLKRLTQVQFAFLCGMVNGCIEFLAGIVDMAVLVIKIRNQMANGTITGELELEMMTVIESVEFLMEQYIQDPEFLKKQMAEALAGYAESRYKSSLSRYVVTHNAGEDTIIAIDIVISVITIVKGLTQAAQKLPKFNKWIDDVLENRKKRKILDSSKRLEKGWKRGWSKEKVLEKPKGSRPDPKEYLTTSYIKEHIELFEKEGIASRIVSEETFKKRGIGKPDIGKTEFVSRKSDIDDILMLSIEEQSIKLGIPLEQIEKHGIVRIDFKLSKDVKVEMPSGNEWGANDKWLPGGILPEGNLEATIKTEGLKEGVHYTVKYLKK
ncbi:MAG: hypothetical protein H3C39_02785 [Flavobacteriia bacterium]|nr:hypothetical protein [Flavobacteriia bacterium]